MFVMNDASMYKIPEISRSVELNNTKVMMIPESLTSYLQPQNIPIKKFKNKSEECTMSVV